MATLPAQHPRLALHLTDRALTPIISSGNPNSSSSTTSSSSSSSQVQQQQLAALGALSTTALTAYDAAKRLEMGSPLRVVVEHSADGPVVLQSFMCPMSLALGPTGRTRRGSDESLDTAVTPTEAGAGGGRAPEGSNGPGAGTGVSVNGTSARGEGSSIQALGSAAIDDEEEDEEDDGANHPPMLIGVVVAPGADDASEARRAAGRLERLARVFQTEWVAEQRRGDDGVE